MARRMIKGKNFTWHHFTTFDKEDELYLRENFQFHELDFEDLASLNPIPKLDAYKNYLFAVFQVPRRADHGRIIFDDLEVFLGADYLVTVTKRPIDATERFFGRVERNSKLRAEVMGKSTSFTLYKLLQYAFFRSQSIVTELANEINDVEQDVYEEQTKQTTRKLAVLRRNVLFLRTGIDPQRSMVTLIGHSQRPFIDDEMKIYFDDVRDILDSTWTVTDNLRQVVDGLFEVNESLLAHRTNDIVMVFTAIAAALMPPTLLAGIYGMNVEWLPFANQPIVVAFFFLVSLLSFGIVLGILKRRH